MSTHTRIGSGAILCLPILLQSMTAMAAEDNAPSSAPSGPRAPGDWSIVAGVSFDEPNNSFVPFSQVGPIWGITLERRLGRHTWMLLGVTNHHFVSAQQDDLGSYFRKSIWSVEGHTGLRYVFNPGKAFEISSYFMAGASHARLYDAGVHAWANSVNGTLGISVDRELIHGVGARISSNLASIGWSHATFEGSPEDQHRNRFYGAIGVEPSIELRITF